ncbi:hypothetical protein CR205_10450 [Alteribacter lacisalsi]|uniref:NlpC/P60 domain-containing protein n=1 Tax=Alteribacter lacisalsi TaxID=2045244 RepID=A0A2W0HPE4_9BACI|nr:C40 family peptidase [Alteribacter lacisalsi]PYZ98962.1 hypothetical protein CR205_10450 [Alteribacter lacisalsi]
MIHSNIIVSGHRQLGKPYVFNARPFQSQNFDCSSFIQFIFHENGINLPRSSRSQYLACSEIGSYKPGDLLFFTTSRRNNNRGISKIGHVALYIGNGKILHTCRPGNEVTVSKLKGRWKKRFLAARRPPHL